MKAHRVCLTTELTPGGRKIVEIEDRSIGVFNVNGRFYALKNSCPHQFAPLCLGKVTGYNRPSEVGKFDWCREGEIIRCPWHAWEFDITTGRSIFNPHKVRTKSYEVSIGAKPSENEEPDSSIESFEVDVTDETVYVMI